MKVGDTVPVNIGAHTVAQATVKELGDGTATLIVPATLVVMGTRTELSDIPTQPSGAEHQLLDDNITPNEPVVEPVEAVEKPVEQPVDNPSTTVDNAPTEPKPEEVPPTVPSEPEPVKPENA